MSQSRWSAWKEFKPLMAMDHTLPPHMPTDALIFPPTDFSQMNDLGAIASRLTSAGTPLPKHVDIVVRRLKGRRVAFVTYNEDQWTVIEDDDVLFPSDQLIIKLRLLF